MNGILPDCTEEIFGYLMDLEENIERGSEVIKGMLRHIHKDVESNKRKIEILERQVINIAYLVGDLGEEGEIITRVQMDNAANLDPDFYSSLNEIYTPVDKQDADERAAIIEKKREIKDAFDKECEESMSEVWRDEEIRKEQELLDKEHIVNK